MSTAAQIAPMQVARFERLLPGPIERVWDYLTQPDLQATWLAESAAELRDLTASQPLRKLEFAMRDSSVVSLELEARGSEVLLVFSFFRPDDAVHKRQGLGPSITGLNSLHSRPGHFTLC